MEIDENKLPILIILEKGVVYYTCIYRKQTHFTLYFLFQTIPSILRKNYCIAFKIEEKSSTMILGI